MPAGKSRVRYPGVAGSKTHSGHPLRAYRRSLVDRAFLWRALFVESLMTLREKQSRFTRMVADLIQYAYSQGFELTFGDAFRDPRVFGIEGETKGYGRPYSVHKLRLAVDLNLFRDGAYLANEADHAPLRAFWESIGGAPPVPGDANHYSLQHQGRR